MSKYRNHKCEYKGEIFDSKQEIARYIELNLLEKAGKIKNIRRQVKFELLPAGNGERAVTYTADFVYDLTKAPTPQKVDKYNIAYFPIMTTVVEDVKSVATAKCKEYICKRKMFKHFYKNKIFSEYVNGQYTKYSQLKGFN